MDNDDYLIYLYRQGNDWALDELYQRYLPIIHKGVNTNKKEFENLDYDQAECLSKCYMSLFNCIDSYCEHKEVAFGAYVYMSIQYVIKNYGKHILNPKFQSLSYDALEKGEASMEIQDFYSDPIKVVHYKLYEDELKKIASELKGVEKAVFTCFIAGYSIKEIIKLLPYEAKTISNATFRIRKKMKKLAKEHINLNFERVDTDKGM